MRCAITGAMAALGLAALAGCKTADAPIPDANQTRHIWASMLAPYNVVPLFPVRTHVQPGDVYVRCLRGTVGYDSAASAPELLKNEDNLDWVKLFSLSGVQQALEANAKTRLAYMTAASAPSAGASGTVLEPTAMAAPFEVGTVTSQLEMGSFPAILSYSMTRSDFGLGTSAGAFVLGAGSSSASQGVYMLEIDSANIVGLDSLGLQAAIDATAAETQTYARIRAVLKQVVQQMDASTCRQGSLAVVSDVYYTRKLDVSMGDSYASAFEARAAYELPANSTRAAVMKAVGDYALGASAPAAPGSTPTPSLDSKYGDLLINLDKIYAQADDNSKLGFTGAKLGLAKSTGKGLSMSLQFAVPVAFGIKLHQLQWTTTPDGPVLVAAAPSVFQDPTWTTLRQGFILGRLAQPPGAASAAEH